MATIGAVGFAMLLGAKTPGTRYAGTFLGTAGIYPTIANSIAWTSNNVEGTFDVGPTLMAVELTDGKGVYKRGVTLGIMIGWGNLNGIVSSNIYRGEDAPNFYPGHSTVLGYLTVFLLGGSILQTVLLRIENRRRRQGERDYRIQGLTPSQIDLLGDERPDFFYTT